MATRGPWSVKGIDAKAREAAREAARNEGVTLGDYLNRLLLEGEREESRMSASAEKKYDQPDHEAPGMDALDRLVRRIEAIETRSTLAMSGMDHSVNGLLKRLENTETTQSAMQGKVEMTSEELRTTQKLLQQRIERMEADDSSEQSLRALKSLETSLERLANRVQDGKEQQAQINRAFGARAEKFDSQIGDLDARLSSSFSDAADRISKAVEESELRSQGANRHLSERMSQLESDLFEERRSSKERLNRVEKEVSNSTDSVSDSIKRFGERIGDMEARNKATAELANEQESRLADILERLGHAEATTDVALNDLRSSFSQLEDRISEFDEDLDGGRLSDLKDKLEQRIADVAKDLTSTVQEMRGELTRQIEIAATIPTEAFAELNTAVVEMHKRIKRGEQRHTQSVEAIGEEVAELTDTLDRRVRQIEERNDSELSSGIRDQIERLANSFNDRLKELETRGPDESVESVAQRMAELSDALTARVDASEERSASAIKDFTEHVSTLTKNLSAKQNEGLERISQEIKASEARQKDSMETALSGVRDRIAQVEEATASSMSPIQRAMASLAERLESVEDFATPPGAQRPKADKMEFTSFEDQLGRIEGDDFSPVDDTPVPAAPKASDTPETKSTSDDDFLNFADIPDEDSFSASAPKPVTTPEPEDSLGDDEMSFEPPPATDDDGFSSDFGEEETGYDLDAAEAEDDSFTPISEPGPNDYIAKARAAANASMETGRSTGRGRKKVTPATSKVSSGNSRLPLLAAVSVVALAAAGTIGYMKLRGKQAPPNDYVQAIQDAQIEAPAEALTPEETIASEAEDASLAEGAEASAEGEIDAAEQPEEPTDGIEPTSSEQRTLSSAETVKTEPAETQRYTPPKSEPVAAEKPEATPTPYSKPVAASPTTPPATPYVPAEIADYKAGMAALDAGQITEGVTQIRSAADSGLAIAQYRMAKLFERGTGVPRDLTQSRFWTEKAANNGNVKAMHDLAVFYADGDGGPQSYAGAVQWFRKAADYGLVDSQYNLGVLYEQGLGVTANPDEALYWFRVAQKLGDTGAASKVTELAGKVSPDMFERTALLADQYVAKSSDNIANGVFPSAAPVSYEPQSGAASDRAASVREAQEILNRLGYNAGAPDGSFGAQTRQAILTFQSANGLPPSGEVTPTLIRQLKSIEASL